RAGAPPKPATETVVAGNDRIVMTWADTITPFVLNAPPGFMNRPIGVFSTFFPAKTARVELNGKTPKGQVWAEMRGDRAWSGAFENRVYEVELDDERRVVVKFYRPGRWSRATIEDEHRFLADLAAAEVPAVAPMDLGTGTTLNEIDGILYAAFQKVRGRTLDEL